MAEPPYREPVVTGSFTLTNAWLIYFNQLTASILSGTGPTTSTYSDSGFDLEDILTTGITYGYGMIIVKETVDQVTGLFRMEYDEIIDIGSHGLFSTTKNEDSTYNIYFEAGYVRIQNKVGNNRNITVCNTFI